MLPTTFNHILARLSTSSAPRPTPQDLENANELQEGQQSDLQTTAENPSSEPRPSFALVLDPNNDPNVDYSDASLLNGPPPLDYSLHTRKYSIIFFWTLICLDLIAVPIGLYFGLWYGTDLSANAVFSISTGCLGGVSIFEYFIRFWRLWQKGSTCRVLGARRMYLDWFHWNFSIAWTFIMIELIIGTAFSDPPIRVLAMPVSSCLFWFAFQLLIEDSLRILGYKSPIRISSMPKGSLFRPGIYSIIEDVVAVDGSGGTRYRKRLNDRFEASKIFRQMLHRLTLFWAIGSMAAAILTTVLVWTLERDAAYTVGWSVPFIWAAIWTACTFWYVKKELKHEKEEWDRVIQTEGIKGVKKWLTVEPRVRLMSVAEMNVAEAAL